MLNQNFSEFTNLYDLSKTLRFELKPIGKTKELLENENLFPKDKKINEIYQNIIKPCLNDLHFQLIEESLDGVSLDLEENDYITRKKSVIRNGNKNDKKKFKEIFNKRKKELRKQVVAYLINSKIKDKYPQILGYGDLMKKEIIPILAEIYGDKKYEKDTTNKKNYENPDLIGKTYKELINEYFIGFFAYLKNFNINRNNFYKDDGKASRIATRAVDENLLRFFQNKVSYEQFSGIFNLTTEQKDCFNVSCFQKYLNSKGIIAYNQLIGKINIEIYRYNQNYGAKFPKLIKLYKQFLSKPDKKDIFTFVDSIIEDDEHLEKQLLNFIECSKKRIGSANKSIFKDLLIIDDASLGKIYLKSTALEDISNRYLQNWDILENLLSDKDGKRENDEKKENGVISLLDIKIALENEDTEGFIKDTFLKNNGLSLKSKTAFEQILECLFYDSEKLKLNLDFYSKKLNEILFSRNFSQNLRNTEKNIKINGISITGKTLVKETLEKILFFEQMLRYFSLEKGHGDYKERIDVEFDSDFYGEIDKFYEDGFRPHKFFNAVRIYLTKKQSTTEKIKLNFDNYRLLDGRDKNTESLNFGIILRKKGNYYLAIMKKGENKLFRESNDELYNVEEDYYEKLEYKLLPGPNKMLPRVFFSNGNIEFFNPGVNILRIRKDETFKQGNKFSLDDLHTWIDFMKKSLKKHETWSKFEFSFKETKEYKQINEFYADVEEQGYKISFNKINPITLEKYVEEGKLYLFQIYNKDFSEHHKGHENLHTKYWNALFEENNFANGACFKLNGGAEIFFRPATTKEVKLKNLAKQNNCAIENKRFTEPKILFHCPITINFVNKKNFSINNMVKEYIKTHKMNIIGINRGNKNLLYYALIDQDGKILEQGDEKQLYSMNILTSELPNGTKKEINYYNKLLLKEGNRKKEKIDWNEIENIKEMKQGYLSHVIHKLVNLAIKNNAIIIVEDLNSGSRSIEKKVERCVYQNFELALAKKLNFVVDKKKLNTELGGLYHAYQLTPKIENSQDIYTQTGILFCTNAWYSSTTCPICGYKKDVYKKYQSVESTKKFINEIGLKIEKQGNDFTFSYNLEDIEDNKGNKRKKLEWILNTKNKDGLFQREHIDGISHKSTNINLSEKFNELFDKYAIDKNNIVKSISNKTDIQLFKDFMFYWNLLLKIQNNNGDGHLQCPACGFHSNNGLQGAHYNLDANGAYNIARRGILILKKIQNGDDKLGITNVEWDNFSQKI